MTENRVASVVLVLALSAIYAEVMLLFVGCSPPANAPTPAPDPDGLVVVCPGAGG